MAIASVQAKVSLCGEGGGRTLQSMAILGNVLRNLGRCKEVEELEVKVMERRKAMLGPYPSDRSVSIGNLAATWYTQGRWKQAEELVVKLIERRRALLGPDHPDTLRSFANLASTYYDQGLWKETEDLQVQAVNGRVQKLSNDHLYPISAITNPEEMRSGALQAIQEQADSSTVADRSKLDREALATTLADTKDKREMRKSQRWWQRLRKMQQR